MKYSYLLSLLAVCLLSGCASKPINPPDISAATGGALAATKNVREAKVLSGGVARALIEMGKKGTKPNDPAVLSLRVEVDTLDAKLTTALSELDIVNTELVKVTNQVIKVTTERNEFQRRLAAERSVTNKLMFPIACLAVAFFAAGQILVKLYASQVTAFIPLLGNVASDIMSYIGGVVAVGVFLLLMLVLQSPLSWLIRLLI